MLRTYLDWLVTVPWKKRTWTPGSAAVRKIMDEDHYGLKKCERAILEYLPCESCRVTFAADSVLRGTAGGREDVLGDLDRAGDEPQVRAMSAGRRARRG